MTKHYQFPNVKSLSSIDVQHKERAYFYILIGLLLLIGVYVYWDFLTFKKLLIYQDIGNDSLTHMWPHLVNLSRGMTGWSFYSGIGQNVFLGWYFDPFLLPFFFSKTYATVYLLPYIALAKIICAGVLIYLYLRVLSLSTYSSAIGGLLYAYCGQMILLGGWLTWLGTAVVVNAFLLYSFELFLIKQKWFFIPISVLSIILVGSFFFYFFAVLIFFYGIFRYISTRAFELRKMLSFLGRLIGLWGLGVAISAVLLLPELSVILNSVRITLIEGAIESRNFWPSPIAFAGFKRLLSGLLRLYSTNLIGPGSLFIGWKNSLEAPVLYTGLLSLLLVPQAYRQFKGKLRVIYGLSICLVFLYISYPYFVFFLNGFFGQYYRWTGLFVTVILIYVGAHSLNFIEQTHSIDKRMLFISVGVLVAPWISGIILLEFLNWRIFELQVVIPIIVFLLLHCFVLYLFKFYNLRGYTRYALIFLVAVEVAVFSSTTVNFKRNSLTASYLRSQNGYFDYTEDAVAYLRKHDLDFYRIIKAKDSVSLNDPLFMGYQGVTSYFPFNHKAYLNFLNTVGAATHPVWNSGFGQSPILGSLLGVKYFLTNKILNVPYGFNFVTQIGDVLIYENVNFLPLGFCYNHYIREKDFLQLSTEYKERALLKAFIYGGNHDSHDRLWGHGTLSKNDIINSLYWDYRRDIDKLRKKKLKIINYNHNTIYGTITMESLGLLFLSIPYDTGWHAKVNGRATEIQRVNIGLMGIVLEKGFHVIELKYSIPGLKAGEIISFGGILIYLLLLLRSSLRPKGFHTQSDDIEL